MQAELCAHGYAAVQANRKELHIRGVCRNLFMSGYVSVGQPAYFEVLVAYSRATAKPIT